MLKEIIGDATLYLGDCLEIMAELPEQSINCCVTSPPYFGLRDYGCDGQIGLEETPEIYVEKMVEVFRGVRRILRDDGTVWLNLGDSYMSNPNPDIGDKKNMKGRKRFDRPNTKKIPWLKLKDLIGIPWRVALALQADGWYLRQDIIWHKPNPMPESVTDRCTKAHEYIFLLSKSPRYFYDNESIKERAAPDTSTRDRDSTRLNNTPGRTKMGGLKVNNYETRNKRSVWTVSTKPYKEAHFAVFPPSLIEPCILAGCPEGGTVFDPFSGSGTTGEVATINNRYYIGSELNPDYVAISVARLKKAQRQQLFDFRRSHD